MNGDVEFSTADIRLTKYTVTLEVKWFELFA